MEINFERQVEQGVEFGSLMVGDIFRDTPNSNLIYMKIPDFHEEYNCIRLDNGEPDFFYNQDIVHLAEYEFWIKN